MTVMGELTAVNPVSLAHPRHLPVPFLFGREENGSEDASTEYIQKTGSCRSPGAVDRK
jgi:hypothetical protein